MTTLVKHAAIRQQNQKFTKKITWKTYLPVDYFYDPKKISPTNWIAPKLMPKIYK